jgi:hypothetical protein
LNLQELPEFIVKPLQLEGVNSMELKADALYMVGGKFESKLASCYFNFMCPLMPVGVIAVLITKV